MIQQERYSKQTQWPVDYTGTGLNSTYICWRAQALFLLPARSDSNVELQRSGEICESPI